MIILGNTGDDSLERLIEELTISTSPEDLCFLCGKNPGRGKSTREHVVPRWAQERYELWNQRLTLLNQTTIPYRQLTVPCCKECNGYRLKPLEDALSQAVEGGREVVEQLGNKLLYLWLGKLFYGILYKEFSILLDRKDPSAGTIVRADFIKKYNRHLLFMQQLRHLVDCVNFCPGSIRVFSAQALPSREMHWDFVDNIDTLFVGCRIGKVAICGCLMDGGAEQTLDQDFEDLYNLSLHPVQFREICAIMSYRSSLSTRTPKHIVIQGSPHRFFQVPLGGFSLKPYFNGWEQKTYSKFLAHFLREDPDLLFRPPDDVVTWLRNEDGYPRTITFDELPILF